MSESIIFTGTLRIVNTDEIADAAKVVWRQFEIPRQNEENLYVYQGQWNNYVLEISVHEYSDEIMEVSAQEPRGNILEAEDIDLQFHGHPEPSLY